LGFFLALMSVLCQMRGLVAQTNSVRTWPNV